MNQSIEDNIEEIVTLLTEAISYNGYKMSRDAHIRLQLIRGRLIEITDGDVDFYFERTNSNARIGMYKITLKCIDEVDAFIKQYIEV